MVSFFAKLIFLALVSQALAMGAHFDMTTEQGPQESEPLPPTKPKKHHGLYPPSCKPTCPTGYAKWSFIANADSACPETYHLSNLPREVIAPQKGLCDRRVKFVFSKIDKIEALLFFQNSEICMYCGNRETLIFNLLQVCKYNHPDQCHSYEHIFNGYCDECFVMNPTV